MKAQDYKARLSRQEELGIKIPKDKLKLTYTISDFYKTFEPVHPISKKMFTAICKAFLEEVSLAVIRERYEFRMPSRLGFLRVVKREAPKHRAIDFQKTKQLGKTVKHLNLHSDQYYFIFKWFKRSPYCYFTNKSYYSFSVVDDKQKRKIGRRGLAEWIQQCSKDPTKRDYDALIL